MANLYDEWTVRTADQLPADFGAPAGAVFEWHEAPVWVPDGYTLPTNDYGPDFEFGMIPVANGVNPIVAYMAPLPYIYSIGGVTQGSPVVDGDQPFWLYIYDTSSSSDTAARKAQRTSARAALLASLGAGLSGGGSGPLTREAIEAALYDTAYSWELQPGSDVMATTIGVLPSLGYVEDAGQVIHGGLVTVAAGSVVPAHGWALSTATSPLSGQSDILYSSGQAGAPITPGVYLAHFYGGADTGPIGGPPYAFPDGWTPGNTTGSGPVLPLIHTYGNSSPVYGGLIYLDRPVTADEAAGNNGWYIAPLGTPLTKDGFETVYNLTLGDPAGLYVGFYNPAPGAPTTFTLPSGWTFRPYGIGPVAITDENAGCLIGDVAYVVSGYVYNSRDAFGKIQGNYRGVLAADSTTTVAVGDTFGLPYNAQSGGRLVTGAGTVIVDSDGSGFTGTATVTNYVDQDYAWPFIERFDLSTKTWLPRVPMPLVDSTNPYAAEGGIAGVIDGKIYFGGGDGNFNTQYELFSYDPVTGEFERLDDTPPSAFGQPSPDYIAYGVVDGKLWWFSGDGVSNHTGQSYDPVTGDWTEHVITGDGAADFNQDQAAGFEIDGKLWFVYNGAAFVFDPDALTVTAKAKLFEGDTGIQGGPFLVNGKIETYSGGNGVNRLPGAAAYDPLTDTWVIRNDLANDLMLRFSSEFAGVTYNDVPYLLSQISDSNDYYAGVYGLTGSGIDRPQSQRLDEIDDAAGLEETVTLRLLSALKFGVGGGASTTSLDYQSTLTRPAPNKVVYRTYSFPPHRVASSDNVLALIANADSHLDGLTVNVTAHITRADGLTALAVASRAADSTSPGFDAMFTTYDNLGLTIQDDFSIGKVLKNVASEQSYSILATIMVTGT